MADLRLTPAARRDLELIREYGTAEFGAEVARQHLQGFARCFALLRRYPLAGEARPEFDLAIRSLSHRPHRLLYQVDGNRVLIVRILHYRQDVHGALGVRR